jgi:hypothetical protein
MDARQGIGVLIVIFGLVGIIFKNKNVEYIVGSIFLIIVGCLLWWIPTKGKSKTKR